MNGEREEWRDRVTQREENGSYMGKERNSVVAINDIFCQ